MTTSTWRNGLCTGGSLSLGLVATLLALGCSRFESSEIPGEDVGSSSEALTVSACQSGADCVLPFELPAGVANEKLVAAGDQTVTLSDRTRVQLEDGTPGSVGNTGTGLTDIGASANVGGVSARAAVSIRSNAVVSGPIYGTPITVQAGASAPDRHPAASGPATVSLRVHYPSTSLGNRTLQPNQSMDLNPGRYGTVIVNRAARLHFKPGAFYLDALQVESGGIVEIDTSAGTEVIIVRNTFIQRGTVRYLGGQAADALIGIFATQDVILEGETDGTIVAPSAQVIIGPANNVPTVVYDGMYFAKALLTRPDMKLKRRAISATGAAIGGVTTTIATDPNTTPPPKPSAAGKTPKQYMSDVEAYIQRLKDTGYRGPSVQIPPPPDYQGNERKIDSSVGTTAPTTAPAPGSTDALVSTAVPGVQASYPETTPVFVDPPVVPAFCPFGEDDSFPEPQGGGTAPPPSGFNETFGDLKPSPVPDFDGWFGGKATGGYGITDDRGLYAELDGGFQAGFSVFGTAFDLLDFGVSGKTQTKKPATGDQLQGSAHVTVLSESLANWNFADTPEPFHDDFCSGCGIPQLLPTDLEIPVGGIVTISFNAGLEAALPASFTLIQSGPQFTFAPMVRLYAIVKATAGQGLRVGVEGQIDVLRIDTPVRVGTKFVINPSPSVCSATIQPTMDVKLKLSTLNGKVFLIVEVFALTGYVEIARWELFSWDGLSYDVPLKDFTSLLPGLTIPLNQATCALDIEGCKTVDVDRTIAAGELTPASNSINFTVDPSVFFRPDRDKCAGQYVLEIPPEKLTGTTLRINTTWALGEAANDDAACKHQRASLYVFAKDPVTGEWSTDPVALRKLQGKLNTGTGLCEPTVVDFVTPDPDVPQDTPALFMRPTHFPGGLRIAAMPARSCQGVPLTVEVSEQF